MLSSFCDSANKKDIKHSGESEKKELFSLLKMNHTVTGWSLGGDECLEMVKTYTIIHTVYFNLKKVEYV
jgi:hypothetical protein